MVQIVQRSCSRNPLQDIISSSTVELDFFPLFFFVFLKKMEPKRHLFNRFCENLQSLLMNYRANNRITKAPCVCMLLCIEIVSPIDIVALLTNDC